MTFLSSFPASSEGKNFSRHVLPNGMVVILMEDRSSPLVTLQAFVRAGSITEQEYSGSGLSHFVEHLLFKGTEKRKVGEIAKEVNALGGTIGGYTTFDHTVYYITLPGEAWERALEIMSDTLRNPSFDPAEIEKEREVILKEILMSEDDPERHMGKLLWQNIFRVHPYGHPIIGYKPLLLKLKREDLRSYHQRMYVPNNVALVVAGNCSAERVLNKVKELFSSWQRRMRTLYSFEKEPVQISPRSFLQEFPVKICHFFMGFRGPSLLSEDAETLEVLSIILGQGESSRLYQKLRHKEGLVYRIESWYYPLSDYSIFGLEAELEPEKRGEVKEEIWKIIKELQDNPPSDREMEKAIEKAQSEFFYQQEKIEGKAGSLGWGEVVAGDPHFAAGYIKKLEKVRPEEVQQVAEKYLLPEREVFLALLPKGSEKENRAAGPKPIAPEIERRVLDNGVTLLLRKDTSGVVTMRIVLLGGVMRETERNNGISQLLHRVMTKGTKRWSAQELAWEVESRGGYLGSYAGYNSIGFSVKFLKKHWRLGMEVLSEILLRPTFPKEEIEKERDVLFSEIKTVHDEIWTSGRQLLRQTFFTGHPYRFLEIGKRESVGGISREDLKRWWEGLLSPQNMVLTVFGEIDTEEVLNLVRERFGQIPPREEKNLPSIPQVKYTAKQARRLLEKEQTLILLAYPGVSISDESRYPLEVLNSILNGLGGRLFYSLRDRQGLAYMLGSFQILGLDPGAFVFYIATTPEKKDEALALLKKEVERVKKEKISQEELSRAKAQLLGDMQRKLETNMGISFQAALDELYGLGYNNYLSYEGKIRSVSAEDIQKIAQSKFKPEFSTLVIVGAEENRKKK